MKKPEIAKRMAREAGTSTGEAADRLDGVVRDILLNLRKTGSASLPGLGRFLHGRDGCTSFKREGKGRNE